MPKPVLPTGAVNDSLKDRFIADSGMRSCGRLGPASDGSTVDRSSDNVLV